MAKSPFEVSGDIVADQIISTNPSESPMVIESEIVVTHLNADLLDGRSGEYYLNYNNLINTPQFEAPPLDQDLVAIAELEGTSGLLRKTGEETWELDTTIYATQASVVRKVVIVIGDDSTTTFSVNHGLGTQDLIVQFQMNETPYDTISTDSRIIDSNSIQIDFEEAPSLNSIRIIIIG